MDEKELQNLIDFARRGNLSSESAARYFQLSGLAGSDFENAMAQFPTEPNPNVYLQPSKTESELAGEQAGSAAGAAVSNIFSGFEPIKQEEIKGAFDTDLNYIKDSFALGSFDEGGKTEESVVTKLQNQYNRYGFKYEEATPFFDAIKVTAPNGQSETFNLPNASHEDRRFYGEGWDPYASVSDDLVSFMNKNMVEDVDKINSLARADYLKTSIFEDQEQIKKESSGIQEQSLNIQQEIELYNQLLDNYETLVSQGDKEAIGKAEMQLRDMKKDLENKQGLLSDRVDSFESNVGRYFTAKEEEGSDIGAVTSFLLRGAEEGVEGIIQLGIALSDMQGARDMRPVLVEGTPMEEWIRNPETGEFELPPGATPPRYEYPKEPTIGEQWERAAERSDWFDFARWFQEDVAGVSEEKMQEFAGKNTFTQVLSGVTESLPAFISPSKALNTYMLVGQTMNQWQEMTSGPEWDDVSENEKLAWSAPFITAQVVLERYGFKNIKGVDNLTAKVVSKVFGKSVGKIGAKTFAEVVEQDVKSSLARAGLVAGNAFLAEAETGLLQEVSSETIKSMYNAFGSKANFDVAETGTELLNQIGTSALHEGLGGTMLGSVSAIRAARPKSFFSDEDMVRINMLRGSVVRGLREEHRRSKVHAGKMTESEAKKQAQEDNDLYQILEQIPQDASLSTQKQLFRKLQREQQLKKEIDKKTDRMSKREANDLKKLQDEIKEIGDNYERLTPEQKQDEIKEALKNSNNRNKVVVETATGEEIEINPEPITKEEASSNQKMEQSPEPEEGAQLSLFDETSTQEAQEPTVEAKAEPEVDKSDFAEVTVENATSEGMASAGFSTEFQSLISNVRTSLGEKFGRNKGDKIINHRTHDSVLQAVKRVNPKEAAELKVGDFVFGFVVTPKDGGPQEIHLLDTNNADFVEQVKTAAKDLGASYKIASATDLVTEELVTHYTLQDFFGENGTKRQEFYDELGKLSESNPALKKLIEDTESEYSDFPESKQQEEVIAAFFNDYVKTPSNYRNIWQRIADWFNNLFKGRRVINTESDLMSVARNVNNIISGVTVDVQAPKAEAAEPGVSYAKASGSTYLQNETIYYDFNRQAGVAYMEWADPPRPVAQKIKVSDYFHFRNWYNKMTANQEVPGIITNMYFVKDGKKFTVNPPKPKVDSEGNKVQMDRIPTFGEMKTRKLAREREELSEMRQQYSIFAKEVGDLHRNSRIAQHTNFMGFVPRGGENIDRDFEGMVLAKKNIQALIDSDITEEQLSEMRGGDMYVIRDKHPEIYNMSGFSRFNEAGQGDAVSDGTISFAKAGGQRKIKLEYARPTDKQRVQHLTNGKKIHKGDLEEINGLSGVIYGYDIVLLEDKGKSSGLKTIRDFSFKPKKPKNAPKDELSGHQVLTAHNSTTHAEKTLKVLEKKAAETGQKEGKIFIAFTNLREDVIAGNPYIISEVAKTLKDHFSRQLESSEEYSKKYPQGSAEGVASADLVEYSKQKIIDALNSLLNDSKLNPSKFEMGAEGSAKNYGYTTYSQEVSQNEETGESEKTTKEVFVWDIKSKFRTGDPTVNEVYNAAMELLDAIIEGRHNQALTPQIKSFSNKAVKVALGEKVIDENGKERANSAAIFAKKNNMLDPYLNDSTAGHLIGYRVLNFKIDEKGRVDLGVTSKDILGELGFNGAIVSNTKKYSEPMKFVTELVPLDEIVEGDYTKSELQTQAGQGGVEVSVSFSRASGRLSSKVADIAGSKGVSMNQLLQIAGKASRAENEVLQAMAKAFPSAEFISKEDFDMFFEGKMLQPLEEQRSHADYGLDRLYGRKYRRLKAVTIPFVGDPEIYGTPGIFSDHFDYPVHAHVRLFTDPDQPGILYISELQSDTYQKGLEKAFDGTITEEVVIENYASDEVDVAVQNLPFLKYILENYDEFRGELLSAAGGRENAINANWWDDVLTQVEVVPEGRLDDAPNVASLMSNAIKNNPKFNVKAFRILMRQYALSNLKAPINSTEKQIDNIINDHFNKYPYIQPGEKNNLEGFSKDLVVSIDYMADVVADIALGEALIDMTHEKRMEVYDEAVKAVEEHRNKQKEEKVEAIPSARKSWERQVIRHAIKRAQENGDKFVRFPTEKTAAAVQWWDAGDTDLQEYMNDEFGIDGMTELDMPDEMMDEARKKQAPLRKRYRDIPKTLREVGLDPKLAKDEMGNTWYEVDTPPSDQRMIMFSKTSGRNNVGDVNGATWEMREQTSLDRWKDLWLVRLQDKYRRVFGLQEDVASRTEGQVRQDQDFRMAEELMYGKAANDLAKLDDATDRITMTLKRNNLTVEDLEAYMYALHVKERNAVISNRTEGKNKSGSGKTDAWAEQTLSEISPEKRQQLEESAQVVREILEDTRNAMVELGLETKETIMAFEKMFKNYVPLQGRSSDEADFVYSPYPNGGTGFSVSGATTKKAKGRVTESVNIIAQVISQNAAVRIKGRTNEAMNALYRLVEQNPNPKVWQVLDKEKDGYKSDDPNIVSVRVNGVQKAIRFKDASYAQSLRKMNMPQTNYFVKAMGSINSWLRAAFTSRNPEFILSNFSRDIQSAIFNASAESEIEGGFLNGTGAMRRIFKLVGPSLKTLVKDEVGGKTDPLIMKYYEEFKEDGGKTGWAYQKSLEDIANELQIDDSGKTGAQKILGTAKGALEFVEGINDAFENSIRLSAYIAAREGGVSREKAAQFAKNITVNFNKQGEWGAAVNATYLFFNASVQGTARLGRSLVNLRPPMRPDGSRREWYERATTAQKAALGMVILNGLLTTLNRAVSDEDEDEVLFYNKIPDYVKERNIIIMRPDGKNYWKIPMPYGYNIFANIGSTSVEVASGDKEALEGLGFVAMSMVNAFSPVSFGQADSMGKHVTKTSIPTAFKPFFEAFAFNETYFGGPVMAEQYPFGTPKPNSSMSFRAPEEVKQFFSWINEATGGSEDVPGIIDINPDGGWYIFEYFLGGTGRFVTRSLETGRKIAADSPENPIDLDFNDVPFMRIVYGEPSKYYDMEKFKNREVEIKQLLAEYKENRIPDAGDRYKAIGYLEEDLKKANKILKFIRAEKRKAKKISDYGERVSRIQQLQEQERKIIMMFNFRYDQLRGED
jgi:hypothetical protein